ncbi:MAG: hypothetical protein WC674_03700 [Candidatus Krumholzibacteriia bacterium]
MTNEMMAVSKKIFSLEFADHLENVDAVCKLMHSFMTAVLQSQNLPAHKKNTADHGEDEPGSFRIHISIYERS